MRNPKQSLIIQQTEAKLKVFWPLRNFVQPKNGWVNTIRIALKMSLRQLGKKLNVTPQNMKQLEEREVNGTITLKTLNEVAHVMDMKLVYGFISKHESLEEMIEKRAKEIATEIVMRTNTSMILEDQQNSKERIRKAIDEKTVEIRYQLPKYLWD
jgi:predicted DNA-binding mobile mystery protein A